MEKNEYITKTGQFKYIEISQPKKRKFSDKDFDIFHISAQNIDCGYLLEPPHRYPCKPKFYYIQVRN